MQSKFLGVRHGFVVAVISSLVALTAARSHAETIKLSQLIDEQLSITNGDKVFSEFSYAGTGDMPFPEDVNVITIQDADGNYGLRFQGGFLDKPGGAPSSDALVEFVVTVARPDRWIIDAHLQSNVVSADGGTATVTESFLPSLSMTNDVLRVPTPDGLLVDSIVFDRPLRTLKVQKNILMSADTKQVDMSFVDQTFSQVPEPTTGWLGCLAVLALLPLIRRRESV